MHARMPSAVHRGVVVKRMYRSELQKLEGVWKGSERVTHDGQTFEATSRWEFHTVFDGRFLLSSTRSLDEALAWARQRHTFGAALVERQVIRHKLVDMQMRIHATEAWLNSVTGLADENWENLPPSVGGKLESDPELIAQVCDFP